MLITEIQSAISQRRATAEEITGDYLQKIRKSQIGAYLTLTEESAIATARSLDARIAAGWRPSPLAGVPMAIKDNICTKGIRTTCASKMLKNYVPPYSATALRGLADCVMLGKTNMDEFAMGSSCENSALGRTVNPRDPRRVPGGSSGGSAAAVAAGECAFALGSDTGGSIRQPAAFSGAVGMKPTYGAVSRYGLVAFASSLDQIGPITQNVLDNALVLNALAGWDELDSTSARREYPDFAEGIEAGVAGLRFALPTQLMGADIAPDVRKQVARAARTLERLGAEVCEIDMPALADALPAYYVISSAEASSNLARFDGVRYGLRAEGARTLGDMYCETRGQGFGEEVKTRVLTGAYVLSRGYRDKYYKSALSAREALKDEFARAFGDKTQRHTLRPCPAGGFDAILSPTAPTTAYYMNEGERDQIETYLGDVCTVPASLAGLPAISLPFGRDAQGMSVGVQLMGRAFDEKTLYRAAYALERECE